MLMERKDVFVIHAHLVLRLARARRLKMIRHLLFTLRSPDLIFKYLRSYYSKRAREMRSLYKFLEYFRIPKTTSSKDLLHQRRKVDSSFDMTGLKR